MDGIMANNSSKTSQTTAFRPVLQFAMDTSRQSRSRARSKRLTRKELRIEAGVSGEDSLVFRITHRTHFLKNGKEIRPTDVAPGTPVAVDAYREPDQKFSALNVVVNPPKPKAAEQ
jgi:hypothetical protein